ncbi:unnamed protein product [Vitrella brassicaformis CCMP3155]|uniref:Nucleotide-diphospho-sugar transferase domain-containing protein n=1 Tax=Vitrella brassicaformis (strain CCMP3155) TaxID=1169540 RepID=A0A0G4EVQ4_VITBC|nr:unnamed protein product [Vitrella brassicaformis CCMP3155]|eukprot:CEM02176.1 unnamed protein product [Vitrella brassicaformis CCMP3155]
MFRRVIPAETALPFLKRDLSAAKYLKRDLWPLPMVALLASLFAALLVLNSLILNKHRMQHGKGKHVKMQPSYPRPDASSQAARTVTNSPDYGPADRRPPGYGDDKKVFSLAPSGLWAGKCRYCRLRVHHYLPFSPFVDFLKRQFDTVRFDVAASWMLLPPLCAAANEDAVALGPETDENFPLRSCFVVERAVNGQAGLSFRNLYKKDHYLVHAKQKELGFASLNATDTAFREAASFSRLPAPLPPSLLANASLARALITPSSGADMPAHATLWAQVAEQHMQTSASDSRVAAAIVGSDIDVQFFPRWQRHVEGCLAHNDVCFQRERPLNTGFFAMRCTNATLAFWRAVRDMVLSYPGGRFNQFAKVVASSHPDVSIPWTTFPYEIVHSGKKFAWPSMVVHHAVAAGPPENKTAILHDVRSTYFHTQNYRESELRKLRQSQPYVRQVAGSICAYGLGLTNGHSRLTVNGSSSSRCPTFDGMVEVI